MPTCATKFFAISQISLFLDSVFPSYQRWMPRCTRRLGGTRGCSSRKTVLGAKDVLGLE
jgi:hypothetical protein